MGIPDYLTSLLQNLYAGLKKQQLELDMEQWTCSKLGKEYVKAVYCHPAYLTYMQSTSCEMPGWMNQSGIKIARRNINNLSYADNNTLMAKSEEELKRDHGIWSHHFMANRWGDNGNNERLYFLELQNHCRW